MARTFNGGNQTLTVVNSPSFNLLNNISMSAWIRPSVIGVNMQIFAKETSLGARNWGLYYNFLNKLGFELNTSVTGTTDTLSGTLTSGVWQHVTGTYDGILGQKIFYINGVSLSIEAQFGTIVNTTGNLYIGSFLGMYSFFNGQISQPTIWSNTLTPMEVKSLSLGFSPLKISPQSIVGHWPLNRNYSPEIDVINKQNLTLINAPISSQSNPMRGI